MPTRTVFRLLLAVLTVSLLACAPALAARGTDNDFYDIPAMPEGWKSSMPPGLNNDQKRSLGHFYNEAKNCAVMIQIAETENGDETLDEVTRECVNSLKMNGCKILKEPAPEGKLMRFEATLTGTPGTFWVGTNGDMKAHTVATGDLAECMRFINALQNADDRLLPVPTEHARPLK